MEKSPSFISSKAVLACAQILLVVLCCTTHLHGQQSYTLKNKHIELKLDQDGQLVVFKNLHTAYNYAGGNGIWRLYFDNKKEKEIEVSPAENAPQITLNENGQEIEVHYKKLVARGRSVDVSLVLRIRLEGRQVRFLSEITNNEAGIIVRELQYPLVGGMQIPEDYQLLTTLHGGKLYGNPIEHISRAGNSPPYMAPSQHFRQFSLRYPAGVAANCFAFVGTKDGIYLGSHDETYQDTWHGLRVYPDGDGRFNQLEAGLYKYPHCLTGQSWQCDANVIVPYEGTWHETSHIYRQWVDTWWDHQEPPQWVKEMKSWQRVILKHQYGETLFTYDDMGGRIRSVGESVGADAVFPFGWWEKGMDHGNPHFDPDPEQGGETGWKNAIAEYKKGGGKVLLYFNGKLIDRESEFYQSGEADDVVFKNNIGAEITENYLFWGLGTFTGAYNSRSFAVADTRHEKWRKRLIAMADQALALEANSVFYDQLGYGESVSNWDLSGEFPIPNNHIIADKASALKEIHGHIDKKDKEFAIGTEWFTDVTAQYVDYIHNIYGATSPNDFIDWVRYTFPEVIISDREIRDDTDIQRRVNHTILKGLRNDIEIYRCRGLIDETPNYQQYLANANRIKDKFKDLLLLGIYRDTRGFEMDNPQVQARCFVNGNKMAVVLTQSQMQAVTTRIELPDGYDYTESDGLGEYNIQKPLKNTVEVKLGKNGLIVLVFKKSS